MTAMHIQSIYALKILSKTAIDTTAGEKDNFFYMKTENRGNGIIYDYLLIFLMN